MPQQINSFNEFWIHALQDLYSAEKQLVDALPKMVEAARSQELKDAFGEHLNETKNQVQRLETIFKSLAHSASGKTCKAMKGLIEEGEDVLKLANGDLLDAALVEAAQKIEHYEIAGYGSAVEYARLLGDDEAAALLEETLDEEKEADRKLTALATEDLNLKALEV